MHTVFQALPGDRLATNNINKISPDFLKELIPQWLLSICLIICRLFTITSETVYDFS